LFNQVVKHGAHTREEERPAGDLDGGPEQRDQGNHQEEPAEDDGGEDRPVPTHVDLVHVLLADLLLVDGATNSVHPIQVWSAQLTMKRPTRVALNP
jgi:hypothetical protein